MEIVVPDDSLAYYGSSNFEREQGAFRVVDRLTTQSRELLCSRGPRIFAYSINYHGDGVKVSGNLLSLKHLKKLQNATRSQIREYPITALVSHRAGYNEWLFFDPEHPEVLEPFKAIPCESRTLHGFSASRNPFRGP